MIRFTFDTGDVLEITSRSIVYGCPAGIVKIDPNEREDLTNLIDIIVLRNQSVNIDPDCGELTVTCRGEVGIAMTLGTFMFFTAAKTFRELVTALIDAALDYCRREGL